MMLKIFLQVIVLYGVLRKLKAAAKWGYEGKYRPSGWGLVNPNCDGRRQSPIAITTENTSVNYSLAAFPRSIFDTHARALLIKNNGHSLQVDITDGYTIDNSNLLPGSFKAVQFHIHWGRPNGTGSEHTLNGVQYFGELHIVHYNTKYSSVGEAVSQYDGLAVLGVFLQDDYPQDNLAFERFLGPVTKGSIRNFGDNQTFAAQNMFSIETLLPGDLSEYYRYEGSLTTPPCYQSVVWTVFATPLRISKSQASVLRSNLFENKKGEEEFQLYGNFRPVQPINGRIVTRTSSICSGGPSFFQHSSFIYIVSMLMIVCVITS